jgi:hypothetical protein
VFHLSKFASSPVASIAAFAAPLCQSDSIITLRPLPSAGLPDEST